MICNIKSDNAGLREVSATIAKRDGACELSQKSLCGGDMMYKGVSLSASAFSCLWVVWAKTLPGEMFSVEKNEALLKWKGIPQTSSEE